MSEIKIGRRSLLQGMLLGAVTVAAFDPEPSQAAAALVKLTETDATGVALGYHINAKKVDVKKFSTYKPEQSCLNCVQLQAGTGNDRGCNLFPGKSVTTGGWCKVWVKKP